MVSFFWNGPGIKPRVLGSLMIRAVQSGQLSRAKGNGPRATRREGTFPSRTTTWPTTGAKQ